MRRWFFLALLLSLLVLPVFAAEEITDKINSITDYAVDFELGKISYLQLKFWAHYVREEVNEMFGASRFEIKTKNETFQGISRETIEKYFGKPTRMEYRVWDESIHHDVLLDVPVPRWEKLTFDGQKIKITFNANPHVYRTEEGKLSLYYWTDFEISFKSKLKFEVTDFIGKLKEDIENYYETSEGGKELIEDAFKKRQLLRRFIESRMDECKELMDEYIDGGKTWVEDRVRWDGYLFKGRKFLIKMNTQLCGDCEWRWIHTDFWIEAERPAGEIPKEEGEEGELRPDDPDYYMDWTTDEIYDKMKKTISDLITIAGDADAGRVDSRELWSKYETYSRQIQAMNEALNRISNDIWDKPESEVKEIRQKNYEEREAKLREMFDELGVKFVEESVKSYHWENEIFKDFEIRQDSWCEHALDKECGKLESCVVEGREAQCILALNNDETNCDDGIDNGEDGKTDCNDPDCMNDDVCMCKNRRWDEETHTDIWVDRCDKPNTECKIVYLTGTPSGADIKNVYLSTDAYYLYIWVELTELPNLDSTVYRVDIGYGEENSWVNYGFHLEKTGEEGEERNVIYIWRDSPSGHEEISPRGMGVSASPNLEIAIPWSMIGYPKDFHFNTHTIHRGLEGEDWVQYDGADKRIYPKMISRASILPDGNIGDWSDIEPIISDASGDGGDKDAHCNCAEGYSDCDRDWENGCETNSKCCGENIMWNDEKGWCDCQPGYNDCDHDWENGCETEGCCWPNTYFSEKGWCECEPGWYDCDGDWDKNGCESKDKHCGAPCSDVCSECWDCHEETCRPICEDTCWKCYDEGGDDESCRSICELECWPCGGKCEDKCQTCWKCEHLMNCRATEAIERACSDGEDNDCDGFWDCEDYDCRLKCEKEIHKCGLNQEFSSDIDACKCKEGFHDCDGDGNCESSIGCQGVDVCAGVECSANSVCNPKTGRCGCLPDYFDCNGIGIGTDEDGCESIEECGQKSCADVECAPNAHCDKITLGCICNTGYHDCDSSGTDSGNGCESTDETCSQLYCERIEMDCYDKKDNDCDGLIDSEDSDCAIEEVEEVIQTVYICDGKKSTTPCLSETGAATGETTEETLPSLYDAIPKELKIEIFPGAGFGLITGMTPTGMITAEVRYCDRDEDCTLGQYCTWDYDWAHWEKQGLCVNTCATQDDCYANQECHSGRCNCRRWRELETKYFDCDGNWFNGCESTDVTCGGAIDRCQYVNEWCKDELNQYCEPSTGDCECKEGYNNCDGYWGNGCETEGDCEGCKTDEDCKEDVCEGNRLSQFKCVLGNSWEEWKARFSIHGECSYVSSGDRWNWIDFNMEGEKFDELRKIFEEFMWEKEEDEWCKQRFEELKKERIEIQKISNSFLEWLFDLVNENQDEFEKFMGGIFDTYWGTIIRNTEETIHVLDCLNIVEWPEEYELISISYEGDFGSVQLWEERKVIGPPFAQRRREVFSPYLKAWIFPPKEAIKEFIKRDIAEGRFGPEGEKHGPGPSPKEIEEAKKNPVVMAKIKTIADRFGGSADLLFKVVDEGETVFNMAITMNEDVFLKIKPALEYTGTPDVTLEVDFDFVFTLIEAQEKDMRKGEIEFPPWENKPMFHGFVEKAGAGLKIFTAFVGAILTGKIKITPLSAIPNVLLSIGDFMSMMMGGGPGGGPGGPKEGPGEPDAKGG